MDLSAQGSGVSPTHPGLREAPEPDLEAVSRPSAIICASECPICFEQLASAGAHQICCLRCGHIFGRSCLERWLRQQRRASDRCCPQCKQRAQLCDIRLLYVPGTHMERDARPGGNRTGAADERQLSHVQRDPATVQLVTREVDECEELRNALRVERKRRVRMELELCRVRNELRTLQASSGREQRKSEPERLCTSAQIPGAAGTAELPPAMVSVDPRERAAPSSDYSILERLNIRFCGQTRCLLDRARIAYIHADRASIYVSTAVSDMKGVHDAQTYTLKEIPLELMSSPVVPALDPDLHRGPIRDVTSNGQLLASASLDGNVSLVDMQTRLFAAKILVGEPLWSVKFANSWEHGIAVGSQRGLLRLFDLRKTLEPLGIFRCAVPSGGIHSMHLGSVGDSCSEQLNFCTLQSLHTVEFSWSTLSGNHAVEAYRFPDLFSSPTQMYCMRVHRRFMLLSGRRGLASDGEHVLVDVDHPSGQPLVVHRASGFQPGPQLCSTDFAMLPNREAPEDDPVPLLLSGDAKSPGALRCWAPGAISESFCLNLGVACERGSEQRFVPNVVADERLGVFAAVAPESLSVFSWTRQKS
jgi:hypothetical protein